MFRLEIWAWAELRRLIAIFQLNTFLPSFWVQLIAEHLIMLLLLIIDINQLILPKK